MRELLEKCCQALKYPKQENLCLIEELEAELAKPEPELIGVVDYFEYRNALHITYTDSAYELLKVGSKIYTHPPAKQTPLSDDEINKCFKKAGHERIFLDFAREIEAAHGIK